MSSQPQLPLASSPSLKLVHPTEAECLRIWTATHPQWGGALNLPTYLEREAHLLAGPLSSNGRQTPWLLTDGDAAPGERPILASCETLKKPSLVVTKDGDVREVVGHGVASVFTFPEMRGKGYAGKMMELLGKQLRSQEEKQNGDAVFSVLYSDIGKKFYNNVGWKPFDSNHLHFPVPSTETVTTTSAKPLTFDDLPPLATVDEQLLRKTLTPSPTQTRIAIIPNIDSLHWHLLREDFMCNHIFSGTPTVRGAIYTPPNQPNSRIWAVFTRNFYGGAANPEKNVLNVLRFVVEDENVSDDVLAEGVKAIMGLAQKEAKEYLCTKIELWNPDERLRKASEGIEGVEYVARESDSIASLQWFGNGSVDNIDWVANEKYGWC